MEQLSKKQINENLLNSLKEICKQYDEYLNNIYNFFNYIEKNDLTFNQVIDNSEYQEQLNQIKQMYIENIERNYDVYELIENYKKQNIENKNINKILDKLNLFSFELESNIEDNFETSLIQHIEMFKDFDETTDELFQRKKNAKIDKEHNFYCLETNSEIALNNKKSLWKELIVSSTFYSQSLIEPLNEIQKDIQDALYNLKTNLIQM